MLELLMALLLAFGPLASAEDEAGWDCQTSGNRVCWSDRGLFR
jgi:hypothetical protein